MPVGIDLLTLTEHDLIVCYDKWNCLNNIRKDSESPETELASLDNWLKIEYQYQSFSQSMLYLFSRLCIW